MASSSSAAASASAGSNRNRAPEVNQLVAAAPPPPPPPPPPAAAAHAIYVQQLYHQQRPIPPRREFAFHCRTATLVLLAFLIIFVISFVIWVIYHPNFPQIHVMEADMSKLAVTNTTATADCNFTLLLTNTNRHLNAIYDRMAISLLYPSQNVLLSQDIRPPFVQPKKNRTVLETNLSFDDIYLGEDVMKVMKEDMDSGKLSFGIKVLAILRYRNGAWKSRSQFMRAYCGGLVFGVNSSRKISNPLIDCECLRCLSEFLLKIKKELCKTSATRTSTIDTCRAVWSFVPV